MTDRRLDAELTRLRRDLARAVFRRLGVRVRESVLWGVRADTPYPRIRRWLEEGGAPGERGQGAGWWRRLADRVRGWFGRARGASPS